MRLSEFRIRRHAFLMHLSFLFTPLAMDDAFCVRRAFILLIVYLLVRIVKVSNWSHVEQRRMHNFPREEKQKHGSCNTFAIRITCDAKPIKINIKWFINGVVLKFFIQNLNISKLAKNGVLHAHLCNMITG